MGITTFEFWPYRGERLFERPITHLLDEDRLFRLLEAMDDPWGLATLEEAMLWLKKLKTFVAKHPTLNKVWFVRDLDLKPLADHIKDAQPSE